MAGTLIIRFLCPAAHFLPSSMYFLRALRDGHVAGRVFEERVQFEATHPSSPRVRSRPARTACSALHQLVGHPPGDRLVVLARLQDAGCPGRTARS